MKKMMKQKSRFVAIVISLVLLITSTSLQGTSTIQQAKAAVAGSSTTSSFCTPLAAISFGFFLTATGASVSFSMTKAGAAGSATVSSGPSMSPSVITSGGPSATHAEPGGGTLSGSVLSTCPAAGSTVFTGSAYDGTTGYTFTKTFTATAVNVLPGITAAYTLSTPHNDVPGQEMMPGAPVGIATCTDPDPTDAILSILFSPPAVAVGSLTPTGPNSATRTFEIINPAGTPFDADFFISCTSIAPALGQPVIELFPAEFTNSSPTLIFSWGACDGTSTPASAIGKSLPALVDGDSCNASGTATPFDADDTGAGALSISAVTPIAVVGLPTSGTHSVPIPVTISTGPITGNTIESATVTDPHGLTGSGTFTVGPSGGGYQIHTSYNENGKKIENDYVSQFPMVTYGVGPLKKICKDVTYIDGVIQLPAKELGEVDFGSTEGGSGISGTALGGGGFTVGGSTLSGNTADGSTVSTTTTSNAANDIRLDRQL